MQTAGGAERAFPYLTILAVLALVPFVSSAATVDPFHALRWLLLALGTTAGIAAMVLTPAPLPALPVVLTGGFTLFSATSLIPALNKPEGLWQVAQHFAWCAWLLLLLAAGTRHPVLWTALRRLAVPVALLGAGYAIGEYWGAWKGDDEIGLGPGGLQGNRNLVASFQLLLAPWVLWSLLRDSGPLRGIAAVAWVAFAYLAVLTQCRAVWAGGVAAALSALALLAFARGPGWLASERLGLGQRSLPGRTLRLPAFLVLSLAAAFLFHATCKPDRDDRGGGLERVASMLDPSFDSNRQRVTLWKKTLELTAAHPLVGVGAGNWKLALPSTGMEDLLWPDMALVEVRPYNDWLWSFSEIGIPGGLCWLGLWAAALVAGIRGLRRPETAVPALLLTAGLLGYGVVSAFDFPKERPEHMAWYGAGLAALLAMGRAGPAVRESPVSGRFRWAFAALFILAAASAAIASARWRGETKVREAMAAHAAKDWPGVVTAVSRIGGMCTLNPAAGPMAWHEGIARHQMGDLPGAEGAFRRALEHHPYHIHSLHNLAVCRLGAGDTAAAAELLRQALEISPGFAEAAQASALLSLRRDNPVAARGTLEKVPTDKRGRTWLSLEAAIARHERNSP